MTQTLAIPPRAFPGVELARVEWPERVAFHEHLKHQPCRSADTFCSAAKTPFDLKIAEENRAYREAVERAGLLARARGTSQRGPDETSHAGRTEPSRRVPSGMVPATLGEVRAVRPAPAASAKDVVALARAIIAAREGRRLIDLVV